jgi:hypothetical protein
MKRLACILFGIILLISYNAVNISGDAERISSINAVRVYGKVTDSAGTAIPKVSLKFISNDGTFDTVSDDEGLFSILLPKDHTGVESSTPESFILHQNYPNPFNPSTVIEYFLDEYTDVNLDIYSITGQHVRSLAYGSENPGMHHVVWDGRNESGSNVAAGIYLYRLRSGAEIQTKKMVLVDGAVTNPGHSGKIYAPVMKHAADYDSEKHYGLMVEKGAAIQFGKDVYVPQDQSECELNIELPITYQPYALFYESVNFRNLYIYPGDSLGIALCEVHEQDLPADCQINLTTGAGDSETFTLSETIPEYLAHFGFCGWGMYGDSRKGIIFTSSDSPVQNNGVIEVDAQADIIIATYVVPGGVSITNTIPVVGSFETVILWERKYIRFGNDWVYEDEMGMWSRTIKDSFSIDFVESATETEISEFIENNNLRLTWQHNDFGYFFRLNDPIHAIDFAIEQEDNPIIKDFGVDIEGCANI